jgi:hypothetical protein
MGRKYSTRGGGRNACRILVAMPERKRPLGRPRHKCVDNIKMDVGELGWGGIGWVDVALDRGRKKTLCEHSNELSRFTKCWEVLE